MKSPDLESEMRNAASRVRQHHLARLRELCGSIEKIAHLGARQFVFGIVNADSGNDGFYQPGDGAAHIVQPVYEDGEIIDLIAWRSLRPQQWFWRIGAGWALGINAINQCGNWDAREPVTMHATPLDWLASGGDGFCILDWSAPQLRELVGLEAIRVSNRALGERLIAAISKPIRLPKIIVEKAARHAA